MLTRSAGMMLAAAMAAESAFVLRPVREHDDVPGDVAEHRQRRAEEQALARAQREAEREASARPRIAAAEAKRARRRARNLKLNLKTV